MRWTFGKCSTLLKRDFLYFCFCSQIVGLDFEIYVSPSFTVQRVLGESLLVVRKIENVQTGPNNRPKLPCVIVECGEL